MNFIEIVNKVRRGILLSHQELDFLLAWLLSDEGKRQFQDEVEKGWNTFETDRQLDYNELLANVHRQISVAGQEKGIKKPMSKYIRYSLEVAAVIILVIGTLFFINKKEVSIPFIADSKVKVEQVEIYNPKGLRTVITLPDSSRVTLNADSHISYARLFAGNTRTVKLEGEAFFEVEKDSLRPFIVEANAAKIRVLGTSFNVRSYPESGFIETTLVTGSLKVNVGQKESLLKPGRQISISKESYESRVYPINTQKTTGWMAGKIYFQSKTFSEIAAELERTFNVNIKIENGGLLHKKFTGKFENGENLGQILDVIRLSASFSDSYSKETNTIIIK